jgi:hypothetical protein
MGGIACMNPAPHPAHGPTGTVPIGGIIMRDVLITTHLLKQPRDAAVARAEVDERVEKQAQARLRAKPAEPGRVVTLARRIRALVARAS